ncbi:MAG TPA: fatty acid desaturase [Vicinamibacterales bacterium]|nr:fatty acid desaturase [Vicinamibacterales bacterium]
MRIYNMVGYSLLVAYTVACLYFAPPQIGPWSGLLIGAAYLVACWFVGGLYLSSVIHMGITHGALAYKEWFVKGLTLVNNAFGIYVNPVSWVNRHRLHHTFSDQPGDPNKLSSDGFWRTMYLCLFPYKSIADVARDPILKSWSFRLVASPVFAVVAQVMNFWLLWLLVHDVVFTAVLWLGTRAFALWVNMIQNYWTHDRRFGYRRHHDEHDNAMNIGDWLPVTATFSACLQNNHHHSPGFLRLSHDESEYDFGFTTVKIMKALGLVQATRRGAEVPKEIPLKSLNF